MFGQYLDYLVVAVPERMDRPGQVRRDQGEQLDDLGIDGIQLTLKCLPLLGHSQTLPGEVWVHCEAGFLALVAASLLEAAGGRSSPSTTNRAAPLAWACRSATPAGLATPGDNHDGAFRVVRDLAAHRAHEGPGEPPAAAGPHDEHVGVTRGPDEFFRYVPGGRAHRDVRPGLADFVRDPIHELPERLLRELQILAVLRGGMDAPVDLGSRVNGGRANG